MFSKQGLVLMHLGVLFSFWLISAYQYISRSADVARQNDEKYKNRQRGRLDWGEKVNETQQSAIFLLCLWTAWAKDSPDSTFKFNSLLIVLI